jgi:uncharacterized protein
VRGWYRKPSSRIFGDAITTFTQNEPLSDTELDRLGDFLKSCKGGKAMNVETLDGFFAALIAGPETVMPSGYYPEVFGGEMSDACEFCSLDEANEILGLMMRHWNDIAGTLFKGEAYVPLLLEDEDGMAHGNDWGRGVMRGMDMRHDGWAELVNDEEHGGCLIPMMMLCHEHDEDPEMRPKPISPEKRTWRLGCWGRIAIFECNGRSVPVPTGVNHGTMFPRSGGTTRVRAARGRNTRSAAAGRLVN